MRKQTKTHHVSIANSLYSLYEALSDESKQIFLKKLLANSDDKPEIHILGLPLSERNKESEFIGTHANFQDICGVLSASHGASSEDMREAILMRAKERFNDCN